MIHLDFGIMSYRVSSEYRVDKQNRYLYKIADNFQNTSIFLVII